MGNLSEHSYAFPFAAGVLTIIALFTPAAYFISDDMMFYGMYVWMFGILVRREGGHMSVRIYNREWEDFVEYWGLELFGVIPSMVCTGLIVISAIVFMSTAQKTKRGKMDEDKAAKLWAFFAIIQIGATIFWIIWIEYYYAGVYQIVSGNIKMAPPEPGHIGFWAFFNPGFGTIGMFLSATLALIGVYVK
jgi:hypothetical protein